MKKTLIFYLTSNDRPFIFEKFINELVNITETNKSKITLLIVSSVMDNTYYQNISNNIDINVEYKYINCPQSNYLPKVRYAIEYAKTYNFEYILKYDSDVLLPTYTLDNLINNVNILENNNNLTFGPCLSTGIPTVEYFIDDFIDKTYSNVIRNEFKKCEFHHQIDIMDYRPMNIYTIENLNEWNYSNYYTGLNKYITNFYKGIHPIRHGFGNDILNDIIIKQKDIFFKNKKCELLESVCDQLVAMCFLIKTENYDLVINKLNLVIDGCDEVPVNRYGWSNNLKHIILRYGYGIHITYNWRWFLNNIDGGSNIEKPKMSMKEYEENFIKKLYDTN
jgi:hypothetical protein